MKLSNIFILNIFLMGLTFAQTNNSGIYSPGKVRYFQDMMNFLGINSKTGVDIFVQVPFSEIQFVRTSKGYDGGYSVTVSAYLPDKEIMVVEKIWNEKINLPTFEEAVSKINYNISHRFVQLAPGEYFIKTTVVDKDSRREHSTGTNFTVKDFVSRPCMSDIMLVTRRTSVNDQKKIVPNVSGNISESEGKIKLYFEIYSDTLTSSLIEYEVFNNKQKSMVKKSGEQLLNKGKTQIYFVISDTSFGIGNYSLKVTLKDGNDDVISSASKLFYSRWVGLPSTVENIDDAIAQLVYIASPDEMQYMESGNTESNKTTRFLEFWKKKDPSPRNEENEVFEEYYRRVRFANENFSHYAEGWRSDRGMVYIILGAPNNIDRHPFEYDSKPYEIWQYYDLNKSFTFLDETGFGDYRLITPLYGDLFRYRY